MRRECDLGPRKAGNARPGSGTVVTLVVLGHDGRRALQVAVLALPALAWLAWPLQSIAMHRVRMVFVWLWAMAFAFDGAARAYLTGT